MAVDAVNRLRMGLWVCVLLVMFFGLAAPLQASPIGARFESTLGGGAVPEILKQYGGEHVLPISQRLWTEEVFRRLVEVAEREDVEYTLTVLNSSELNAFAVPGGYIFITRGLVNAIGRDEARLAAVLGHEIAHIEKKHGLNAVLRQMGLTVLLEVGAMALDFASADLIRLASTTLLQLITLGWGREAEYEADLIGQDLAVRAGFDSIGAVSLLDGLMNLDSEDLPMKLFRTHPDTKGRRDRLEANLASYWSEPAAVEEPHMLERLNGGRNLAPARRNDPRRRYQVMLPEEGTGLLLIDEQAGQTLIWLDGSLIKDFAWSPQGQHLAVIVDTGSHDQVWVCDRWGYVKKQVVAGTQRITYVSWSPEGQQLALHVAEPDSHGILLTHLAADVLVPVGGGLGSEYSIWLDNGLFFISKESWYHTAAPEVRPVTIPNPVPQVLQRQRILSPTVVKEENTIRLTRPSLTMP